ncbi:MAG TPA: dNTP triphosphohydrolase [Rhodospirillales bacterium]
MSHSKLYSKEDWTRAIDLESEATDVPSHAWRNPFRRDYARLLHCPAFRRLQGKMQLFAGLESDFFRNRLTHSLEVAQISKSIALKLNQESLNQKGYSIDTDLVEFAGLAHDLGHAPFGHSGEYALNERMRKFGGFEGNAQTLRILCRLEKKLDSLPRQLEADHRPIWFKKGRDNSIGLNLCYRTLAAIIKYDKQVEPSKKPKSPDKGYYAEESPIVSQIRSTLLGKKSKRQLRTVECQIMDLADDIAYSTYDIEDAFKAGFLEPLDLFFPEINVLRTVAERTGAELGKSVSVKDVNRVLERVLRDYVFPYTAKELKIRSYKKFRNLVATTYRLSKNLSKSGFARGKFTSGLVNRFMSAISVDIDDEYPLLSNIKMRDEIREEVVVLKHLTYVSLIESNRMKAVSYRSVHIINTIFDALMNKDRQSLIKGEELLPIDFSEKFRQATIVAVGNTEEERNADLRRKQARIVCDFIAGMTDRYAIEFYGRLTSESFHTIFRDY